VLDDNGDGTIDYSELAAFARGEVSPVPLDAAAAAAAAAAAGGGDGGAATSTRPVSPAWSARSGTTPTARRTATASPAKPAAVRSQAEALKHVDAMQKRQDAKHAEFVRRKQQVEEERLAKEEEELSFQPNVARREIEALFAKHNQDKSLRELDGLLAKHGERRLLTKLRKQDVAAWCGKRGFLRHFDIKPR
jgi:hypothetical protein